MGLVVGSIAVGSAQHGRLKPVKPKPLTITCPAAITVSSAVPLVVTYPAATTTGGVTPVTVTGNPASGSVFPVALTTVFQTATDARGATAACGVTITVTAPAGPSPYGPQATIVCPVGAIDVWPGPDSVSDSVAVAGASTTFCLRTGVHALTHAITPKSGDTFVGEWGTVLDGTGWSTGELEQAAFRAHNQDINDVTIRNVVIRNMPQRGIHAYSSGSCDATTCQFSTAGADRWTIEHVEIDHCGGQGIAAPSGVVVRDSYIHHCLNGGYLSYLTTNGYWDHNEFAYNGNESKISLTQGTTFRNSYLHNNSNGVWYDGENTGSIIEGNTIEDNAGQGIFYEVSGQGTIRNNTIRRNGGNGIFISLSHNVDVAGNALEDNYRGINFFVDCSRVDSPEGNFIGQPFAMHDDAVHDNSIRISTAPGAFANGLNYANCDATQLAVYTGGSQHLTFSNNTYLAPTLTDGWWLWGASFRTWAQWQAIPQDATGSVGLR